MMNTMKKIGFSVLALALVSLSGSNMQAAGGDFAEQQAKMKQIVEQKATSGCPFAAGLMLLKQEMASLATTEYFIAKEGAFKASLQAAMVGAVDLPIAKDVRSCEAPVKAERVAFQIYGDTARELTTQIEDLFKNYGIVCRTDKARADEDLVKKLPFLKVGFLEWVRLLQYEDMAQLRRLAQQVFVMIWEELELADPFGPLHNYFFGDIDPSILLLRNKIGITSQQECLADSLFAHAVSRNYSALLDNVLSKNPEFVAKIRDLARTEPLSFLVNLEGDEVRLEQMIDVLFRHGCFDLNAVNLHGETVLTSLCKQYEQALCAREMEASCGVIGDTPALQKMASIRQTVVTLLGVAAVIKSKNGIGLALASGSYEKIALTHILSSLPGSASLWRGVTFS